MGRLIEESRTTTPMSNDEIVEALKTMVFGKQAFERFDAKERETLDKAWNLIDQYETHLKANLVAMLEDLDLQIDESTDYNLTYNPEVTKVHRLIRNKINALRGNEDDDNY